MSIQKEPFITFHCDSPGCDQTLDTRTLDWEAARKLVWSRWDRTFKVGNVWHHWCWRHRGDPRP